MSRPIVVELENIIGGHKYFHSGHGCVLVKYHTFQTRGQGFKPLCEQLFAP